MKKLLIAGNWKMNLSLSEATQLLKTLNQQAHTFVNQVAVFPPGVYLSLAQSLLRDTPLQWGAQDVSAHADGAYTGEISARMLADLGCKYVIIGHSERRQYHRETDELVLEKCKAAQQSRLTPIICIGETATERKDGLTFDIVRQQLSPFLTPYSIPLLTHCIIAYEPVWAIGTGLTATPEIAQDVHLAIRQAIAAHHATTAKTIKILYGGSVKPDNAASLFSMPDIDGGLIGGASLSADSFMALCRLSIS